MNKKQLTVTIRIVMLSGGIIVNELTLFLSCLVYFRRVINLETDTNGLTRRN